jgi:spore maturation protein CgeB
MSGQRLILGMANMALVMSEPMYKPAPYVPGKHYVSATLEEMPQIIRYYLAHEDERETIAREGHRFVTQEVTLERSVSQILRLITMQKERSLANGLRELEGRR